MITFTRALQRSPLRPHAVIQRGRLLRWASTAAHDTATVALPSYMLSPPRIEAARQARAAVTTQLKTLGEQATSRLACNGATHSPLVDAAALYMLQEGKRVRPLIALLMGALCRQSSPLVHADGVPHASSVYESSSIPPAEAQFVVAMVAEMIHTASLVHDDVIDEADTRRAAPSVNTLYGVRQSVLAGNFILGKASLELARLGNVRVIEILSQVLDELVCGEFMQLQTSLEPGERFERYLVKTYKKTASLIACSCRAVAVLATDATHVHDAAFEYGRNAGIAFQLVDDLLDFVASAEDMGKPVAADLKLGLATAPVLYASVDHDALHQLIVRRFQGDGDVELARQYVLESSGLERTRALAADYAARACAALEPLPEGPERDALVLLTRDILTRNK